MLCKPFLCHFKLFMYLKQQSCSLYGYEMKLLFIVDFERPHFWLNVSMLILCLFFQGWILLLDPSCSTSTESPWPIISHQTGRIFKGFRPDQKIFLLHHIQKQVGYRSFLLSVVFREIQPLHSLSPLGNTWLSYIIDLLYFGPTSMSLQQRVPTLEIAIPGPLTGETFWVHLQICLVVVVFFFVVVFFKSSSVEIDVLFYFIFCASTASHKCEKTVFGTDHAKSLKTSPRLIKTHLPVQLISKSVWDKNCRVGGLWSH